MSKLVCGVGINDSDYRVTGEVSGHRVICKFYLTWKSVLYRCNSEKLHRKRPAYSECSVCAGWLTFSNFKKWMETQDWKGKELDKDILVQGNKVYSPDMCAFVDAMTNLFVTDRKSARGLLLLGASYHKASKKIISQCANPFTNKVEYLGLFDCENKAHEAWKRRKHELACQLADLQTDERVANALRARYL